MMNTKEAIESLSFEDALDELSNIVRSLETGEAALDQSIAAYERGKKLEAHCNTKLRDAQAKIEKLSVQADGSVTATPFDTKEE